jgi:hypothetical protein
MTLRWGLTGRTYDSVDDVLSGEVEAWRDLCAALCVV